MSRPADNAEVPRAIAFAQVLHGAYTGALDTFQSWMRRDRNAEEAMLLELIDSIIRRREQDKIEDPRAGTDGDGGGSPPLPSAEDLMAVLDTQKVEPIRNGLRGGRDLVHTAAAGLIRWLQSDAFLDALDGLDPWEQVGWIGHLSERLPSSAAGLSFLTDTIVVRGPMQRVPAFHMSRLLDLDVDFVGDLDKAQAMFATVFAKATQNLLPAVLGRAARDGSPQVFISFVPLTMRFYDVTKLDADGVISKTVAELRTYDDVVTLTDELQRFDRSNPQRLLNRVAVAAGDVAALAKTLSGAMSMSASLLKVLDDPSARNTAALTSSVASATLQFVEVVPELRGRIERELVRKVSAEAIGELDDVTRRAIAGKLTGKLLAKLGFVTATLDAAWSFWDAGEAFVRGDTIEGVGHTTGGIGTLAMAGGVVLASGMVTGVGLVLVGAGAIVVLLATDDEGEERHALTHYVARSWFGTEWDDVILNTHPGTIEYRWKRWDDPDAVFDRVKIPDIARQISTYLSWLHPVNIVRADHQHGGLGFQVRTAPELASPYSFTTVRVVEPRFHEERVQIDVRVPTLPPHDWTRPDVIRDGPSGTQPLEEMEGDDRVRAWSVTVEGPVGFKDEKWIEVGVSLPSQIQQMLTGSIGGGLPPGVEDHLRLSLFQTARLPVKGF